MKLLFVLENYYPHIGGVETLFKHLCESLAARGDDVTVFTSGVIHSAAKKESLNGVKIVRTKYRNRYLFTFFSVFALIPFARKCDHIHTTSYNAAIPARIAAWWCKKSITITFHELWGNLWYRLPYMTKIGAWLHNRFEQIIIRLNFDRFVAVSEFTKNRLIRYGVPSRKVIRIYNGIPYDEFQEITPIKQPGFTYCYFGRLGVSKGLDLLLQAAPHIKKNIPNSNLKLIIPRIPASFHRRIQKMITELDLEDHITELNHLPFDQLKSQVSSSDVVVIPSYSEGFCFSAVEAMALGTPLVISGRGALDEVVTGRYIRMENLTPEALAKAVQKAYHTEWQFKEPTTYPLDDTIAAYQALFDQISAS